MGTTAEKLQKLISTKAAIKTSLENKGLTPTDKFDTYPALIDSISGGGSGDVDIDFIASENINAGDKVYFKLTPMENITTGSSKYTAKKVSSNNYVYTTSNTEKFVYYYDSISGNTYNSSRVEKGVQYLELNSDKCICIDTGSKNSSSGLYSQSASVILKNNVVDTTGIDLARVTGSSTSSSVSFNGSATVIRLTKVKFLIAIGIGSNYASTNRKAVVVTLDDTFSSIISTETIFNTTIKDTYFTTIYKYGKNQFYIVLSGTTYKKIKFSDDYSTFSDDTSNMGTSIKIETYLDNRYDDLLLGTSDTTGYYRKDDIYKKVTDIYYLSNGVRIYKDGKIYVKSTEVEQQQRPYYLDGSLYMVEFSPSAITTEVVKSTSKSGGIFVGYAKTSATAGNNVTVSMVADYILDTEDVQ